MTELEVPSRALIVRPTFAHSERHKERIGKSCKSVPLSLDHVEPG